MRLTLKFLIGIYFLILSSGCSMPVGISTASWVIDGASYIVTKKSITDHGISFVAGQDCALFRLVTNLNICQDYNDPMFSVIRMAHASDLIENHLSKHQINETFYSFDMQIPRANIAVYRSLQLFSDTEFVAERQGG